MMDRGVMAAGCTFPRNVFAALCLQAMERKERGLISQKRIQELLDDPHNQIDAALSIDTLNKLCRQAMSRSEP